MMTSKIEENDDGEARDLDEIDDDGAGLSWDGEDLGWRNDGVNIEDAEEPPGVTY